MLSQRKLLPSVLCYSRMKPFLCRHATLLPLWGGALRDDTENDCAEETSAIQARVFIERDTPASHSYCIVIFSG